MAQPLRNLPSLTPEMQSRRGTVQLVPAEEDQNRLVEHYFRFLLAEESGPLRERLQRGLVELALKTPNQMHSMAARDVRHRIERFAHLPAYPEALVEDSLRQLVARGEVQQVEATAGKKQFRLRPGRFAELDEALAKVEVREKKFRSSVIGRLEQDHGRLGREAEEAVEEAFAQFVGQMLSRLGERCATRLVHDSTVGDLNYPSIEEDLGTSLQGMPTEIQGAARAAFKEALRSPSAEEQEYLYTAGQVYYIAEILHVDPALQALQRERFEETTVFLDTNLLIALLLPGHRDHTAVANMVSLCRGAGLTLVYAERTAEELDDLISGADGEYRAAPPYDLPAAAKLAEIVENPFLQGWLNSYSKHRSSWNQFRARIAAWRSLFEKQEINIHLLPQANRGDRRYQSLKKDLGATRKVRPDGRPATKRPRAVEHDAEVLSSIRLLGADDESPPHPFGARYWFITLDRRLVECARRDNCDVCMLAAEWIQYVSPFFSADVSRLDSASAFAGLLASRFMPRLGFGLTLKQLQVFTQPSVAKLTEDLSGDEASRAVAAARREAVRQQSGSSEDEEAIRRLVAIADKERVESRHEAEAEEVGRLKAERDEAARQAALASEERLAQIRSLQKDLEETRGDQKWSVSFWLRELRARATRAAGRFRAWRQLHPLALAFALIVVVAAALGLFFAGVTIGGLLAVLVVAVPFLATDFEQLRRNLSRFLRKRR